MDPAEQSLSASPMYGPPSLPSLPLLLDASTDACHVPAPLQVAIDVPASVPLVLSGAAADGAGVDGAIVIGPDPTAAAPAPAPAAGPAAADAAADRKADD
jgi:hypothetical protein